MSKAIQEIVADLRKADMSGAQVDAGHVADQIELACVELEDKWRQRVSEVEKIISLARDKYAVHECGECAYRKRCDLNINGFGSAECLSRRVSISLMLGIEDSYFTKLLDDIEAAAKREAATCKEPLQVGNAAAMREALLIVKRLFDGRIMWQPDIRKAHEAVDAAISDPPRNCDVGTPEDQSKRFRSFCLNHTSASDVDMECCRCHLEKVHAMCELAWAQMPYEAQEGGAE